MPKDPVPVTLADAERVLLAPAALDRSALDRVFASIHTHDVDFADLYFQHSHFESWSLEEGIVKSGTFSIDRGVGVRAVSGERQAYAYSDDISAVALDEAAVAVRAIGRQGQSACAPLTGAGRARALYPLGDPVGSLDEAAKVAVLHRLERMARDADPRVVQVMASLAGEHETVLIEDGILRGYLQDRMNAALMNVPSTGNGRRESFAHLPMPRMTNTVMLAGERDPQEILASVKDGLYAVNFGGGQVDITSGKFVFSAAEAWRIEGGRLAYPVKGATLIGNGPDVLTRVSMVGRDMELDPGVGTCGKDGQSVPVGVGQPTLRIDGLTVGGTGS